MVVAIPVREIMSADVKTIEPSAAIDEAASQLHDAQVGSLVVAEDSEPVGIVSESDVVDVVASADTVSAVSVDRKMRRNPVTIRSDAHMRDAAALLQTNGVKQLPVVTDGDLTGVVTTTDITAFYPRATRRTEADGGVATTDPGTNGTTYESRDWEFADDGSLPEEVEKGDTFRFEKEIAEADIEAFAQASGDTNRLHLDDEFAAQSRFGRRIAHGMLVAGVISATLARLPGTVIYLSQSTNFVAPVDTGERVRAEVTAAESLGGGRWRLDTTVVGSDDETVIDGEAVVLAESTEH